MLFQILSNQNKKTPNTRQHTIAGQLLWKAHESRTHSAGGDSDRSLAQAQLMHGAAVEQSIWGRTPYGENWTGGLSIEKDLYVSYLILFENGGLYTLL